MEGYSDAPNPPESPAPTCQETCKELADTIRSLLDHESEAIHQRMGWLGTFQGLLLAGTGVMWDKGDKRPVYLFSALGFCVSAAMFLGLFAASIATDNIQRWWSENAPKDYWGPGVISFYPSQGKRWLRIFAPWFAIPVLFIASWIGIGILNSWRTNPPPPQPIPAICKQECTCLTPPKAQEGRHAGAHSTSRRVHSPLPQPTAP